MYAFSPSRNTGYSCPTLISVISFILLSVFSDVTAGNYYFSTSDGDDSRTSIQASNPATPWKTIAKLNSFFSSMTAGDSILFKRGNVFTGTITPSVSGTLSSPIIISAYGSGFQPIISGFQTVTGWTNEGSGIYSKVISAQSTPNMVTVNGVNTPKGRFPKNSYLILDSFITTTSITDSDLNSAITNWTGAEVVIRKRHWIIDKGTITNHSGSILTYSGGSTNPSIVGYGYFIQNDVKCLTAVGEWAFRSGKIFMFFGTNNPDSYDVKISTTDFGVNITGRNYMTISGLSIQGFNVTGVRLNNSSRITINTCDFNFSGSNAVTALGTSTNLSVLNSTIQNSNNKGIKIDYNSLNANISNNSISATGVFAGMGDNTEIENTSSNMFSGITSRGAGSLFENNAITNSGYIGIFFSGNNVTVNRNYIDGFCAVTDDGAGIYTTNKLYTGRVISNNIVVNGIGAGVGTSDGSNSANGIYLDYNASNVNVIGNTIANCPMTGIYIHNGHDNTINENTVYNCDYQLYLGQSAGDDLIRNNTVINNIFTRKSYLQEIVKKWSYQNDVHLFGTFSGNYYVSPFGGDNAGNVQYSVSPKSLAKTYSFNRWISDMDATGKTTPFQVPTYTINSLIGGNKFTNGTFTSNVSNFSRYYTGTSVVTSDNTNKINGGSAKFSISALSTSNNVAQASGSIGDVTAGTNYIARFSLLGSNKNRIIRVNLIENASPYRVLTKSQYVLFSDTVISHELLFTPTISVVSARLIFYIDDADGETYFDNIEFYEADVSMVNPENHIQLEYNITNSNKMIILDGTYMGVNKSFLSENITLPPYTSILLIKTANTNKFPTISNQLFQLEENKSNGTNVGTIIATDPDAGQTLTYSIVSGNTNGAFAINVSTGVLSVANVAALNSEVTPAVALVIKVQDNGTGTLSSQATITISLTDVNESPVILNQAFSVAENSANGTTVGTIVASDPDAGQTFSFQIVSGNTNNAFTINASTGKLSISNSTEINFTINPVFLLGVQVSDNGSGSLSNNAIISLTILPGNNQVPVINDQIFTISQNSIAGTLVGIVQATDANMEQILAFAILSGNPDEAFSINSSTREIFVSNNNFIHSKSTLSYSLVVQVKDNGQISLSNQAIVTVILLPVNEPPVIQNQILNTLEHNPSGSFVGNIIATDPDSENPVLFSITSGNYGDGFDINPNNGLLAIKNPTAVCYEGQPIFNLFVKAQDGEGLTSEALITINVADINEKPICNNQVFSISENVPAQTIVGSVVAHDNDFNQTLTYSIVSGNLNNAFTINPSNGMLEVSNAAALNFEETGVFELIISVADNGPGYLTKFLTVTIELLDVNEPPVLENQVLSVVEKASPGAKIGFLKAKDPDKGQTVKYMIASGNESHAFNLNDSSGLISVDDPTKLSYGRNALFALTVIAQDNGVDSLSTLSVITIYILPDSSEIIQTGLEINSMAKVFDEKDISVYPNPTADIVNINLEKIEDKPVDIQIFNMAGYSIYSSVTKGEKNIAVSMKDQKPGSYIVLINIDGQMCSRNIIVQNRN